jgi:heme oxygenase
MSLKDLTKDVHRDAERQSFVKVLMSGEIDPELYATFLANQHPMYDVLESLAGAKGLLNDLPDIRRAHAIHEDFMELWTGSDPAPQLEVTKKYIDYLREIEDDEVRLFAHVYTRHMGDLSGGKMIALKVPGEGRLYKFKEPDTLKAKIRERLTDAMADESKVCFEFATQTFREMMPYVKTSS